MKKIGFIGLGNMGSKMSVNLVKKGFKVTGYDIKLSENKIKELIDNNVFLSDNVEDAINNQNYVITMLPNGQILENVLIPNYKSATKGTIFIDSSTIDITTTKKIHDIISENNMHFLDAPVSGGVVGAINASLTFMVGGNENIFQVSKPLFEAMGSKAILCGENSNGQAVKMCNNMILAITMMGLGETINVAKKLNIDLQKLFDVVSTSSGACWALNNYCPVKDVGPESPADNNFNPGFSTNLMVKDLSLAINAAKELNMNVNIGNLVLDNYKRMIDEGKGDLDFSSIIQNI
jgi:3-hydroxyisobutyrate dehydrogenase